MTIDTDRNSLDLGGMALERIVDLEDTPFSVFDIYPDATEAAVRAMAGRFGPRILDQERSLVRLSFHSILVRVGSRTILVDTCCGNHKERPQRPAWHRREGPFLDNLARAGVRPENIDFVMCTHLHADHVGWNTRLENGRWVPTFPNAQYLFAEAEYSHWKRLHDAASPEAPILYGSFSDSVLPVVRSGQAVMVAADHSPVTGVEMEPAAGHTPGNVSINLAGRRGRAVLCGDILHHPVQLVHPDWSTRFCSDPEESRRVRRALLDRVADTDTYVLPAHFQAPSFGRVVRDAGAFTFDPA